MQSVADCFCLQLHAGTMRAASNGTVRLQSTDPHQHPAIDPAYMSEPSDVEEMRQCVRLSREIMNQPAFDKYNDGESIQPALMC